MAHSSVQSLKMEDLDYWQSKERLHRLRSETSRLRLQLKPEQRESRSACMERGRFHQFRSKAASNSRGGGKEGRRSRFQKDKYGTAKLYQAFRAKDEKPVVQSLLKILKLSSPWW